MVSGNQHLESIDLTIDSHEGSTGPYVDLRNCVLKKLFIPIHVDKMYARGIDADTNSRLTD